MQVSHFLGSGRATSHTGSLRWHAGHGPPGVNEPRFHRMQFRHQMPALFTPLEVNAHRGNAVGDLRKLPHLPPLFVPLALARGDGVPLTIT